MLPPLPCRFFALIYATPRFSFFAALRHASLLFFFDAAMPLMPLMPLTDAAVMLRTLFRFITMMLMIIFCQLFQLISCSIAAAIRRY